MAKIFLLEDDSILNDTITEYLEEHGHSVISVFNGFEAQEKLYESRFDILLLDINVPNINGFQLLKESRKNGIIAPAIYITSMNSVDDLQKGFESGCDDYIRKPFELKELLIRIDTLLKRSFYHDASEYVNIDINIKYDIIKEDLIIDNKSIILGNKESKLLKLFLKYSGEVILHEKIYKHLWDYDEEPSDSALRTYIKNLRKIIGKDKIVSIKKQGYKFNIKK